MKTASRSKCQALLIALASAFSFAQQSKVSVASVEALIRSQQYDDATTAIRSGLQESPNDFRLWTLEGIVYSIQGKRAPALAAFDRALAFSPTYPAALRGEVQLLYQTQDLRAIPLLERILKADPGDATAEEMIANLFRKKGDCAAASQHFFHSGDAIDGHPASLEAYGYCLVQTKQSEKAVPVFRRLAQLLPHQEYPKYDLALVLLDAGQNAEAVQLLEPLMSAEPSDPDLLRLASEAYEAQGDTPKAVSLLRQSIVLNPLAPDSYVAFAALCLTHDSFQVGVDMLNAGLDRMPREPSLYISRGLLYAQLAQYEKAEDDFRQAENLNAQQSLTAYAMDLVAIEGNHSDKALAAVRLQLKQHPDSAELHFLLAKVLSNQGPDADAKSSAEAMHAAQQAIHLKPDMVDARDLLASMYLRRGEYQLAADQCRIALHDSPSDRSAMYHLIIALRHSEKSADREQIPALVKRLGELQQASLQEETNRKRFRFEEQSAPAK